MRMNTMGYSVMEKIDKIYYWQVDSIHNDRVACNYGLQ